MIERIIQAVITRPLLVEWAEVRDEMTSRLSSAETAASAAPRQRRTTTPTLFDSLPLAGPTEPRQRARRQATTPVIEVKALRDAFLERLRLFRVLDPACGSGNFLYTALKTLKDIELQVIIESESLGVPRVFPHVGPDAVLGLEKNSYAVELARVTVWIGEIQWMLRKGYDLSRTPVLSSLPGIVEMDAILDESSGASMAHCRRDCRQSPFHGLKIPSSPPWQRIRAQTS
jgi:hypothetical protein